MNSLPIQLTRGNIIISGILRLPDNYDSLLLISSATTGTRIGPHRMFVEIAIALAEENIATFCFDLPPLGDSSDSDITSYNHLRFNYSYVQYYEIVCNYIRIEFPDKRIILSSISAGCNILLNIALKNNISDVILISAHTLQFEPGGVNYRNLKAYLLKLFDLKTWQKLFALNINLDKVIKNTFTLNFKKKNITEGNIRKTARSTINATFIFADKDPNLKKYMAFNDEIFTGQKGFLISKYIVQNSDHSYYSIASTQQVLQIILQELKTKSKK